ncbi:MAG: T9SS type A sorting domain-containing protein [Candidatus Cloacimonetes bacterium]|nr:T9SS type A sorting domain-containing protein [Candidatus Cloacimonadota bacterium]
MTMEDYGSGQPMMETWTIFGDAALQVRTAAPILLSLSNEVVMTGIDFSTIITRSGNPVEGALVSLYQDGVAYTGFTDETGNVTISHSLDIGNAKLVVTGFNTETIYNDITVIGGGGAYVIYEDHTIDDSAGNNNGLLDYGEAVLLNITMNNAGTLQADNVDVTLSSTDTYITISDDFENFGNISAGQSVTINGAFSIEVDTAVPDGHVILFNLEATDGTEIWTSNFSITAHTLPAPVNAEAAYVYPDMVDVLVEWEAPTTRDFLYYKVYCDGSMIADNITELSYLDANVIPGDYVYNITAVYDGGESDFSNNANVFFVDADNTQIPMKTELLGNYPNPFNPSTTISFSLTTESTEHTELTIYNLKGQIVKILVNEKMSAGNHSVVWNGTDEKNQPVSSGIYFYRMRNDGRYTSTKKMILLK